MNVIWFSFSGDKHTGIIQATAQIKAPVMSGLSSHKEVFVLFIVFVDI